jgi:hypothetical protein
MYDKTYIKSLSQSYVSTPDNKTKVPSRSDIYNSQNLYLYQGCTMLIDTQKERNIDLGNRYTFNPMSQG